MLQSDCFVQQSPGSKGGTLPYPSFKSEAVLQARIAFGRALKAMIQAQPGLTTTIAARLGGTSARVLNLWMAGDTDPNPRVLTRVARANDFDYEELVACLRWGDPEACN